MEGAPSEASKASSACQRGEEAYHVSIVQHVVCFGVKTIDDDDPRDVVGESELLDNLLNGLLSFEGRRER